VKGVLSHWQVKLREDPKLKGSSALMMKGLDIKFPILIGDQYHTTAYFMTAQIGNAELCKILATIEENFSKVFYSSEKVGATFDQHL